MLTDSLFMVRPACFGFDEETAASNVFQHRSREYTAGEVQAKGLEEFEEMVRRLRKAGIRVHIGEDRPEPCKPSAVFPNNWVSFHQTGAAITYPMATPSRRLERREAFFDQLGEEFEIRQRIRMETFEADEKYLESTGSLVLDREHRLAYACRSVRTHPELVAHFCERFDYRSVFFHAVDLNRIPIYHTNVVMAMGDAFVVICLEAIPDPEERSLLETRFAETGKQVIAISDSQMASFAGNMLLVKNREGEKWLVMSEQARHSLTEWQVGQLEQHARLLDTPLYTIEHCGGGSARCMMAEIFLPKKPGTEPPFPN